MILNNKMYINYFYFIILIFSLFVQFYNHKYEFVNYSQWTNLIKNYQIYLINNRDYCIIQEYGLIYDKFVCVQNIIIEPNYLNMSYYNITQIIPLTHNKNNYWIFKWIIYIYMGYLGVSLGYQLMTFIFKYFIKKK